MVETNSEEKVLVEMLVEDVRSRGGDHPDADLLLAYLGGELDESGEERLQDHLAGCRECTETLLDLETISGEQPVVRDGVGDFELGAAWRDMQARVKEKGSTTSGLRLARLLPPIAAGLALVCIGLSVRVTQLGRTVSALENQATVAAPLVNPPTVYLDPMTRDDGGAATIALESDHPFIALSLTPSDLRPYDSYDIEIVVEGGALAWRGGEAVLSDHKTVRLLMPTSMLAAGDYRVRLSGRHGHESTPAGEYRVRVEPPPQ